MYCADQLFGLNSQSLAILHLLVRRETSFAEFADGRYKVCIVTTPWYNGAERGVALQIFRGNEPKGLCRIVTFGERREDDGLFVEYWDQPEPPFNAPTVEQRDEILDYQVDHTRQFCRLAREIFLRTETTVVADRVYELLQDFYERNSAETKTFPCLKVVQ